MGVAVLAELSLGVWHSVCFMRLTLTQSLREGEREGGREGGRKERERERERGALSLLIL